VALLGGVLLLGAAPPSAPAGPLAVSSWVFLGANDRLQYKADPQGNRVMDFSSAGYEGGGVALPNVAVAKMLTPASGDNTSAIQAAIDAVSAQTPDANGFRGAVVLAPGTYDVGGTITLSASGVVLRGSGSGAGGTILNMPAGAPTLLFSVSGSGTWQTSSTSASMTDAYIPSGAASFNVSDASAFHVGDSVLVERPVTQPWVHLMGMDTLTSTTGGAQTWIPVGTTIRTDRSISAIQSNQITLDVPLADSFDSSVLSPPGGSVRPCSFAGRIAHVGVEHLQVIAPPLDVIISSPQYRGAELNAVADTWLADVVFQDTQNTVTIDDTAKRVTVDNVRVTHTVSHTGDRMADFGLSGTQILLNRCSSDGTGEWPLVTQGEVSGPIVALHFSSTQLAGIGPHQRWAVGLLADNATLPMAPNNPDGGATGISYSDRGNHGSGQGWAMGWGVAWNVTTPFLVVQQPPGGQNWCIGCIGSMVTANEAGSGKPVPNGVFESLGTMVSPGSLYLAQLCDRLGSAALVNIGYSGNDCAAPSPGGTGGGTDAGGDDSSTGSSSGSASSSSGAPTGSGSPPAPLEGGAQGTGTGGNAGNGNNSNNAGAPFPSGAPAGCGCAVPGSAGRGGTGALALGGLLVLATVARRRVSPSCRTPRSARGATRASPRPPRRRARRRACARAVRRSRPAEGPQARVR
jgi:MYXO-CTERM domain-containing protein